MKRLAGIKFTATRHDTPHPIIDLREVGSDLRWRVKAENVTIEQLPAPKALEPGVIPAYEVQRRPRCRCARCYKYAPRKGGKNVGHKFVCASCAKT